MDQTRHKREPRLGFTLLELIFVVGIIGVLLLVTVSSSNTSRDWTRDSQRISSLETVRLALQEFHSVCGEYPDQLTPDGTAKNCPCTDLSAGTCTSTKRVRLGDFLPELPDLPEATDRYQYVSFEVDAQTGRCEGHHVGVQLQSTIRSELNEADTFDSGRLSSNRICRPTSGSVSTFDGDPTTGMYSFVEPYLDI